MVDGSGTSGLNLESLLRAQERVTAAEEEYVTSILTYNLSMVNLKRSNGSLLQTENVNVSKGCEGGCNQIHIGKNGPAAKQVSYEIEAAPANAAPANAAPANAAPANAAPTGQARGQWVHPSSVENVRHGNVQGSHPQQRISPQQPVYDYYQN